jgi:hypothetical protein
MCAINIACLSGMLTGEACPTPALKAALNYIYRPRIVALSS